jgi:hypothetical protein
VPSLFQGKIGAVLVVLVICTMAITGIACELHATPHAHAHAAPTDHHDGHAAPDSTIGFLCLAAVLPAIDYLPFLLSIVLSAMPMSLKHTVPAFPLFIPPRALLA